MKEFHTAVKEVTEPDEADTLRFKIDETEIVCFRPAATPSSRPGSPG